MKKIWAGFWEIVRKYLFSTSWLEDLIFSYASKLVLGSVGGFGFMIGGWILKKYFFGPAWNEIEDCIIAEQVESKNESKLEDYNEIIQKPNLKPEEFSDAYDDYIDGDFK